MEASGVFIYTSAMKLDIDTTVFLDGKMYKVIIISGQRYVLLETTSPPRKTKAIDIKQYPQFSL